MNAGYIYLRILLPLKEFELLFLFATNCEQVFTRDHLLEKIWGLDYEGTERTVDMLSENSQAFRESRYPNRNSDAA
ncbi:hypothetical protein BK130_21705 [Viridibacillus sp. FSL H8-0123]|nr:hypothetical protein BK130_21705 [Viridibacillus sp. FSL H8-0123]OMC81581.1 hypothetical protein BK128_21645 [Viridibacillus sp. FSL H7-0596]